MENLKAKSLLQSTLHPLPTLTSSSPSQFSSPLFRHPQMLIPSMGRNVVEVVEKWEEEAARSGSGEKEIDVSECFQSLTEEMITRTAFGVSYEDGRSIFGLQTQQMMFAAEAFNKVFVPGYRFLPTRRNAETRRLDRDIKKSLVDLIHKRREKSEAGDEESESNRDLLGRMIAASERRAAGGPRGSPAPAITVQDIVEECKTFFFAGKQTTSNLLTWTTVLLAMHPEWQDAARAEVIRHCGPRSVPTKHAIAHLKTMSMILNESLRLYPPVVATIRRAKSDVPLGPYRIPAGMELLIPILAVHHDPRLWGSDATEFDPKRFADGAARAAKHPMSFIPFGLGPRTCIGQNLALLQAKLVLSILLQRFSFRPAPSYRHAPTVLMLLYPQHGAPILFKPLQHDQHQHSNPHPSS
ncbi:unnamed protein product [Victoria cruziana]